MTSLRKHQTVGPANDVSGDDVGKLGTLNPIPPPRIDPPIFAVSAITTDDTSKALVFHAGGDSGGTQEQLQERLARIMSTDSSDGQNPSFLLHLGDVMYGANKDADYLDRFYRAYDSYPYPIIAIPGNHDGEVRAGTDRLVCEHSGLTSAPRRRRLPAMSRRPASRAKP